MSLLERVTCVGSVGMGLLLEGERMEMESTKGKLSVSEHLGDGRQKQTQLRRTRRKSQRAGMQRKGDAFHLCPCLGRAFKLAAPSYQTTPGLTCEDYQQGDHCSPCPKLTLSLVALRFPEKEERVVYIRQLSSGAETAIFPAERS